MTAPDDRESHGGIGPPVKGGDAGRASRAREAVQVSARVILHPEQVAVRTIVAGRNTEVRHTMVERVGYCRFLLDPGAETARLPIRLLGGRRGRRLDDAGVLQGASIT